MGGDGIIPLLEMRKLRHWVTRPQSNTKSVENIEICPLTMSPSQVTRHWSSSEVAAMRVLMNTWLSLWKGLETSSHGMWLAGSHIQEQATCCCRVHCYHMGSLESDDKLLMVKKIHGKQRKNTAWFSHRLQKPRNYGCQGYYHRKDLIMISEREIN